MFEIKFIDEKIKKEVVDFITTNWGSPIMVTKGKIHSMDKLPGFVGLVEGNMKGLITYHIDGEDCEIVSLDSLVENKGIGNKLIECVIEKAKEENCKRVWLITTNDNTRAVRFYQKRGFDMTALHVNAVRESRKIKPEIPLKGYDDIPILHEIEFEKML